MGIGAVAGSKIGETLGNLKNSAKAAKITYGPTAKHVASEGSKITGRLIKHTASASYQSGKEGAPKLFHGLTGYHKLNDYAKDAVTQGAHHLSKMNNINSSAKNAGVPERPRQFIHSGLSTFGSLTIPTRGGLR